MCSLLYFFPLDPSPQLFCFLPGHRQPFCSFIFAAFSAAVLHVVMFHLQSLFLPPNTPPQLFCSFFLQPFPQLFCMLQSLFLPPNLSLQLFCSILGHRQPFCRAFPAAFSAAVLHVVIYYLQPPFFLPTLHRSCFAFSWSPAAVLQLFLCSLRQLF